MTDADLDGILKILGIIVGRQGDDDRVCAERLDLPGHLDTVHDRHFHIGQNDVRSLFTEYFQSGDAVCSDIKFQFGVFSGNNSAEQFAGGCIVLNVEQFVPAHISLHWFHIALVWILY